MSKDATDPLVLCPEKRRNKSLNVLRLKLISIISKKLADIKAYFIDTETVISEGNANKYLFLNRIVKKLFCNYLLLTNDLFCTFTITTNFS